MFELIVICVSALLASGLTLFSGFGLGTILMPVFALFFPLEVAVASTAVVHLLNNLFKLLLGKHADRKAVIRFGLPALLTAFLGAWVLLWFTDLEPVYRYQISGREFSITPVKIVISLLMIVFAIGIRRCPFDKALCDGRLNDH